MGDEGIAWFRDKIKIVLAKPKTVGKESLFILAAASSSFAKICSSLIQCTFLPCLMLQSEPIFKSSLPTPIATDMVVQSWLVFLNLFSSHVISTTLLSTILIQVMIKNAIYDYNISQLQRYEKIKLLLSNY